MSETSRRKIRSKQAHKQQPTTHPVFGLLVGAGINQQPQTVRVTIRSGTHERRISILRVELAAAHTAPTQNESKSNKSIYEIVERERTFQRVAWRGEIAQANSERGEARQEEEQNIVHFKIKTEIDCTRILKPCKISAQKQMAYLIFAFNIGTLCQQRNDFVRVAIFRGFQQLLILQWCKYKSMGVKCVVIY